LRCALAYNQLQQQGELLQSYVKPLVALAQIGSYRLNFKPPAHWLHQVRS
jgi:hypothetical protein